MKYRKRYKSKQLAFQATKIILICSAFLFIYFQLQTKSNSVSSFLVEKLKTSFSFFSLVILLFLSSLNLFFEVIKWQNLVSYIQPISVKDAFTQTFSSMTLASFTPNGIGEYGAKVLYYPKTFTKKILLLNLLTNGIQMVITTILGGLGCFYLSAVVSIPLNKNTLLLICGAIVLILIVIYKLRNQMLFGFSISKTIAKIGKIPREIHIKNTLYAVIRYAIFCHQYIFILYLVGVDLAYHTSLFTLFTVYLFASIIPTFQIVDVAIKGSVGIYLFGLFGVDASSILLSATIMWFFNAMLPSLIGSVFVFKYNYKWV